MANNISVKDASASTQVLKTTDTAGVHTPHHLVDGTVAVTDNGGSLTVDGTVTANAGTNLNTSALALESTATSIKTAVETLDNAISGNEMQVDIVSSAAIPVTDNSGSLTVDGSVTALPQTGNVTEASTKTITTGGTHQQVFAANADRKFLLIQNVSDTDMNLGIGYNPTASTGIFLSKSGGGVVFESGFIPTQEIRILCATTGKAFVALQG